MSDSDPRPQPAEQATPGGTPAPTDPSNVTEGSEPAPQAAQSDATAQQSLAPDLTAEHSGQAPALELATTSGAAGNGPEQVLEPAAAVEGAHPLHGKTPDDLEPYADGQAAHSVGVADVAPWPPGGESLSGNVDAAPATLEAAASDAAGAAAMALPTLRLGRWWPRLRPELPIAIILAIAALLRLYGYNWDDGTDLHPDERGVAGHILGIALPHSWAEFWSPSSPLNPHFSAYGHLPFYATAGFAHILAWLGATVGGQLSGLVTAASTEPGIVHSGRILSGLADTGTLLFVYLIARMVFGRTAALLAALLGCFTVLDLEFSHFANVDTFLAFCITGALYFCVRIVRHGRQRDYVWAGIWIGFAISCKISAAPLFVPLIVAHIYRGAALTPLLPFSRVRERGVGGEGLPSDPLLLLLAVAVCAVTVFVTMPYAFIDFNSWWSDVWYQLQLAQGSQEQAFTRKFSGLPAYWYPLQQLVGWTMGLPLGLATVAGTLYAIGRQIRRRHGMEMVLLSWAAIYFVLAAGQYMKFLRYMLPLSPVLTIFAAALLVALWRWAGALRRRALPRLSARAVVLVVTLLTILYGLSYENIYTSENTRLAATRWMAAHIPAGAAITVEDWDETLPWPPPGLNVPPYRSTTLTILGPGDNAATTVPMFIAALRSADYITIASARDFASVAHQPGRYPYSIRWYDLLFAGKLNFKLVKSFTNPPHLGPFSIDDYQAPPQPGYYDHLHLWYEADQNLSEYNAPPVYIFKRTGTIDPARAQALLTHDDHGHLLTPAVVAYDPTHSMLLPQKVEQADQKAPTYDSIFPPDNPLARIPLLSWLVMIELLGLLALPLVMRAGRGLLRDGGYALAKLCGIVVVGYLTWLAASLHVATYSRGLILASCLALLLLSLAFGLRPRALLAELRRARRGIVWAEVIFIGAFLLMAAVRMAYPDLWHITWGGERTQEISFTNAILRSQYFPPADPWFAGGTLNYYYYGQYLTGMLMKLIGIGVPIGFNLALPTLYALMLSIAFAIGFNATGRAWVGWLALALEGVLGNLGTLGQFAALAPVHAPASYLPIFAGLRDTFSGLLAVLTHQAQLPPDFFWGSSRILATPTDPVINEYPIWSFTYGDMHAHVVDIPIVLAVIGLALAVSGLGGPHPLPMGTDPSAPRSRRSSRLSLTRERGERRARLRLPLSTAMERGSGGEGLLQLLVLGGLMAVVAGATGPTNLWDLPTALFLLVAGFGLRGWFMAGRRGWALALRDVVAPGAVLGLLCLLLYRPFYSTVLGISSGFTFVSQHTATDQWLLHLGLPLFLLVSFWLTFLARETRPLYWARHALTVLEFEAFYQDQSARLPHLFAVARAMARGKRTPREAPPSLLSLHVLIFGALAALGTQIIFGFTTLALIAALVTVGTVAIVEACARARHLNPLESQPFALVLAVTGLGLTAIPDLIMQNEAGRMNTFFKLYNQAWPLLALSGALALAAIVQARRRAALAATSPRAATTVAPVAAQAYTSAALTRRLTWAAAGATAGGDDYAACYMQSAGGTGDAEPEQADQRPPVDDAQVARHDDENVDGAAEAEAGWTGHRAGAWRRDEALGDVPAPDAAVGAADEPVATNGVGATFDQAAPPGSAEAGLEQVPAGAPADAHLREPAVAAARTVELSRPEARTGQAGGLGVGGVLWAAVLVVLLCGGALFPIFGINNHVQIRSQWPQAAAADVPNGLDGAAFVRKLYPGDYAAIQWINADIHGMPVLLTSDRGGYRDFAAKVTMFTGLPTITGSDWENEDKQERYSGQARPASQFPTTWVNQFESGRVTWNGTKWVLNLPQAPVTSPGDRSLDVETIYNTPDPRQTLTLLHEYHVSYVYVGIAERGDPNSGSEQQNYGRIGFDPAGLAKFDRMVAAGQLRLRYDKLGVKIYQVV